MRTITQLVPLVLFAAASAGVAATQACGSIPYDTPDGREYPVGGVIRGSVTYNGPPPCTQNGHVVGNALVLVFDRRNPPPPSGLGTSAVNFGVVSGDVLFRNWPVTQGAAKVCPSPTTANETVTAPFAISPMGAGSYYLQAFFDYTGNFFATFKFRQLPEATDVAGGAIDLDDANTLVPNLSEPINESDGGITYPLIAKQNLPNFQPRFVNVDVGIPGAIPSTSLRQVPDFTMPSSGYVADDVQVLIGARLPLSRPYFYPEGTVQPFGQTNANVSIQSGAESSAVPAGAVKTGENPTSNPNFVPVLSFPQDLPLYAQPNAVIPAAIEQYQASFPQLKLRAGVPKIEQDVAGNVTNPSDPFHMQLGLPSSPSSAPNGNGGIFVWWNESFSITDCAGLPNCTLEALNFIPENSLIPRLWPLVVLQKLVDLPKGQVQPNPDDPSGIVTQGSDLTAPVVIIQGITLANDSLLYTAQGATCSSTDPNGDNCAVPSSDPNLQPNVGRILPYPDPSNLQDHVTVMLRPSVVCVDPRHPDRGGIVVTPGTSITADGIVPGPFPPADVVDIKAGGVGKVVDSHILTNPQFARIVDTTKGSNGLVLGCLPKGRYSVNLVYPTSQAWTTPNETGGCAAAEGTTLFSNNPGTCSTKGRPVLYSQGTRAVVEITDPIGPGNCVSATPDGTTVPAVPAACQTLPPE